MAVAATVLLLPGNDVPPPTQSATAAAVSTQETQAKPSELPGQRVLAPSVCGTVLDAGGNPVAGIWVTMTDTEHVVASAPDGAFTFRTNSCGRCRLLPVPGWLAIESPLLDLCASEREPTLLVARSGRPQGRVCDPDGLPVANARVAVSLHATLPQSQLRKASSVTICGEWSCQTDADGWYYLPPSPIGDGSQLLIEHDGFTAERFELRAANGLLRVTLRPAVADAALATDSNLHEQDLGAGMHGWLLDDAEQPRAGWWAVVVPDDAAGDTSAGFSQPPVPVDSDGSFAFRELGAGTYRIAAWQPQNRAVLRSQPIQAPASNVRLCVDNATLPERIRGRVRDVRGQPICAALVGLARPTGWAVPGHLAMHVQSIVTTDRDGYFELATNGLAALELIVAGDAVVPQRFTLTGHTGEQQLELRAARRQWLVHRAATASSATTAPTLTALDARDNVLPMWCDDSQLVHPSCVLSSANAFGFPANSHSLVLMHGDREVGRLHLRR